MGNNRRIRASYRPLWLRRFWVLLGALVAGCLAFNLSLACTSQATATKTLNNSFSVGATPELTINNRVGGSVTVHTGTSSAITVQTTLSGADHIHYQVRQEGESILVDVEPSHGVL